MATQRPNSQSLGHLPLPAQRVGGGIIFTRSGQRVVGFGRKPVLFSHRCGPYPEPFTRHSRGYLERRRKIGACRCLLRHAPKFPCPIGFVIVHAAHHLDRPSGLRAGSPPFPPPRLIRPTVRLLPRSPRFRVRVPITPAVSAAASGQSGGSSFRFGQLLKLSQNIAVTLSQVAHHARIAEELAEISIGQN